MDFIDSEDFIQYRTAEATAPLLPSMQKRFPYTKDKLFSFILCGNVKVNEETVKDHTRIIKKDSIIALLDVELVKSCGIDPAQKYVSRGGNKLAPVLAQLDLDIANKVWLDCGCATGGFTECLLQNGAMVVHAVDVAYNTLDYKLRIDSRVIVHERCNVLDLKELNPRPAKAVADLSFRSLRGIASNIIHLCEEKYLLALCKPQFEYGMYQKLQRGEDIDSDIMSQEFDGVLEDRDTIYKVMFSLLQDLYKEEILVSAILPAGIKGRYGNQEYFMELIGFEGVYLDETVRSEEEMWFRYEQLLKEVLEIV